jgi:hypothetical protein
MIIPPFAGVRLVAFQDRLELVATYCYREIVGLGRFKADKVGFQSGEDMHPMFNAIMEDKEIWVVVQWRRFDDGHEKAINIQYLDPDATEAEARKAFDKLNEFLNMSKKELEDLSQCFEASDEDLDYIENRFAKIPEPPAPQATEDYDVYQARLKALAGVHPNTTRLLTEALLADDAKVREALEKKAVQAYFADLAQTMPEEMVVKWQKSNPVNTEWLLEFARMYQEPGKALDPINHELALNWIRRGYNLLTEEELSDAILVMTGQRLTPGTIKKRRERLGLTTKRLPGPRPNSEQ